MNILIVGATGDVGSEAAKAAVARGYSVKALVRPASDRDKLGDAQGEIAFCEGDMLDSASLADAVKDVRAVLISIRLNQAEMQKGRTYKDVERQGVVNIVEAAREKGLKKIIFVSADGVGPDCVSDMYQSKFQAEEAIRNAGLDYTIFRPSGMFKDFDFFHIPNVLKLGETDTWPFGPVDYHMAPLSHLDLAACMISALDNDRSSGRTISIGGPDIITQGELLTMIAREAGINARYTRGISKQQLVEQAGGNPQAGFFTPEQLQDFINDSSVDHGPVRDMFGIEFQHVGDYIRLAVPRVRALMQQQ